jgi:two-component system, LytTR family, sensor kinase
MFFNNQYRYWFILALAVYTYVNTAVCRVYDYFQLNILWYQALISITLITLCTWEFSRLIYPFVKKIIPATQNPTRHLGLFFATSLVGSLAITAVIVIVFEVFVFEIPASLNNPLKLTLTYTSLISLLFHLLNAVVFYMTKYKSKQLEAEELMRINAQAQLQNIKAQVNPHFLFNNLNVLSTLVMQNSKDSNSFIEAFSKVYHYILKNQDRELIELDQELNFLQPYMYLLNKRFPQGVTVTTDIDERWKKSFVVPAAVQMLVENAIKHNIISHDKPLAIKLHANGTPELEVSNNLQLKITKEPSSNIGLNNINKRYELITGKRIKVVADEKNFKVSIPLIEMEAGI